MDKAICDPCEVMLARLIAAALAQARTPGICMACLGNLSRGTHAFLPDTATPEPRRKSRGGPTTRVTEAELKQVVSGKISASALARQHGITPSAVNQQIRRRGMRTPDVPTARKNPVRNPSITSEDFAAYEAGRMSADQLMAKYGLGKTTVYRLIKKHRQKG